ncbi:MAG: Uma2 family endonuclease [Acidobacteria bacterium]|nr:Uma2 family endonuclease [Acidobacteriota bacterium]
MTDDEFAGFCAEHSDLEFETTAEGELIVMPPTFTLTGVRNNEISAQLRNWARQDGRGVVADSSTGWVLPDTSRRSPDAAWILKSRLQQLDPQSREKYWHICPDFVIELRSSSDRLRTLREKMLVWLTNGASLAWLIDPERRVVEVFQPGKEPLVLENPDTITAGDPIAGFTLLLPPVWDPLA